MEILKRFKMQKKVSQKNNHAQQKLGEEDVQPSLTTIDDETLNELDLPAEIHEDVNLDNTFRQTVFNPAEQPRRTSHTATFISDPKRQALLERNSLQRQATFQTSGGMTSRNHTSVGEILSGAPPHLLLQRQTSHRQPHITAVGGPNKKTLHQQPLARQNSQGSMYHTAKKAAPSNLQNGTVTYANRTFDGRNAGF